MQPLEWLYRRVVMNKRKRFLAGEGEIYQPPVPLIVVGNITVGGTGKTPLILWMIEHCQRSGLRVGVVSRGYGAKPPQLPWRVEAEQSADIAGDEPLLIVQRTGVPLMIDPDRSRAVKALLASEPLDLILSDDGMQHYRLARDLELVLIDAARGLGNQPLPAGRAVARAGRAPAKRRRGALQRCRGRPRRWFCLPVCNPPRWSICAAANGVPSTTFPRARPLHAVAGIGNPQRFFKTLETLHWQPVPHAFADHAEYSVQALNFTPSLPLVMTEKDAVKCRAFAAADWWYLAVDAVPSPAFVAWFDTQLMRLLPARLLP